MTNITLGLFGAGMLLTSVGVGLIYAPAGIITLGVLAIGAAIGEVYG